LPKALGEFKDLQEERPQVSKVSNEKLLEFLGSAMHTTKEVAQFLGVENGTAFSRLKRLAKSGIVVRRWEGNRSWWVSAKAVGVPIVPTEETSEEVEEETAEEEIETE